MPIYEFEGKRPKIHESAWIADSADIIGDVTIGPDCYIGWQAVLRADHGTIEINQGSAIEEGVLIHESLGTKTYVGKQVTIGHGAMLHSPILEDYCVIGMRATVSNHARVGSWAIIGENGLVTERKIIPPESICVGSPVKVIGKLEKRHLERWQGAKKRYLAFVERNKQGLCQVKREDLS